MELKSIHSRTSSFGVVSIRGNLGYNCYDLGTGFLTRVPFLTIAGALVHLAASRAGSLSDGLLL
jgi:hypothetical protein